jgi:putative peptidoglycan lipid II flippase
MVKRVFKLVYGEIRGLHQAAYILAFFAVGSQMLALVRDRLLAHSFGAGTELDLYYTAFRVPDLMFALFSSVLSVYVLLPFVTKARKEGGDAAAREVLGQMFTWFVYVYLAVAVVLFVTASSWVNYLFPGFGDEASLLTLLIRILLLQPFLLGLSSLYGVVTQLSQRFVLYAISPLIYNIGIIFGIAVLYPVLGLSGLVIGVVLGALGHFLIQMPLVVRSELAFTFVHQIDWKMIRSVFKVAVPRAITLSIHQLVLLVLIGLATLMATGSVSVFQFAFNLQSVPLAIIGMSYSVAAFPVLAELFAQQNRDAFLTHVVTAIRHILFWSLPILALVIVLRAQIVRVVLGSGEFTWNDTRLTAAVLALFVVSLVFQSLILLLVRAFYAGGNTRTPLIIALIGAATALFTAIIVAPLLHQYPQIQGELIALFRLEGVVGTEVLFLALSFVIGVFIEAGLLVYFAGREFGLMLTPLLRQCGEAVLAAMVGGVTAYVTLIFIVDGINQETFIGISLQGLVAGCMGIIGSLVTYYALGSNELREIYTSFRAKLLKTDVIAPQSETP